MGGSLKIDEGTPGFARWEFFGIPAQKVSVKPCTKINKCYWCDECQKVQTLTRRGVGDAAAGLGLLFLHLSEGLAICTSSNKINGLNQGVPCRSMTFGFSKSIMLSTTHSLPDNKLFGQRIYLKQKTPSAVSILGGAMGDSPLFLKNPSYCLEGGGYSYIDKEEKIRKLK